MKLYVLLALILCSSVSYSQDSPSNFDYLDVFALQWVSNPQISPYGKRIVYERMGFDIMNDKQTTRLWIMDEDGTNHVKLTNREVNESDPIWSPGGGKIAFRSETNNGSEVYIYSLEQKSIARISQLEGTPTSLSWSPDGKWLAFQMFKASPAPTLAVLPKAPKGANWGSPARITTRLKHEADGEGYLKDGFSHIHLLSTEGGLIRQLTVGNYNYEGNLSWGKNSQKIYFSANRSYDREYNRNDSNIFSLDIDSKKIVQLTAMNGPEFSPIISPNGEYIAYLGYEDKVRTYQLTKLFVMNIDGSQKEMWLSDFDRSIYNLQWRNDSKSIYFAYDEFGHSTIAKISNAGRREDLCINMGGTTIGRPYPSGSFTISKKQDIAYTLSHPSHPAELAYGRGLKPIMKQISNINTVLIANRNMSEVEEVWYQSSIDDRKIQGWIVKPPNYDKTKSYPLLVENHGGPILNYGNRFSAEFQLYAAKGYLVFYPNPRGSTSYGEEFGDLLYNNYPGEDYQDVMDGVDYLIAQGFASEDNLFVTGGSAGGTMTAWIIGKNNRFKAAVVHKPVINWISKTLVADNYYGYANYRYAGQPWENFETYWKFSPISLVGNIETPTMVMVGMNDLRTPPSEAKQLYHALKLRKIKTMLIEFPDASHSIAKKPSNLIAKVAYTLAWCDKYR